MNVERNKHSETQINGDNISHSVMQTGCAIQIEPPRQNKCVGAMSGEI